MKHNVSGEVEPNFSRDISFISAHLSLSKTFSKFLIKEISAEIRS